MNEKKGKKTEKGSTTRIVGRSAKELAVLAVFVALLLGGQTLFSALPGVEIVTLLVVSFSFAFGASRGMLAVTAFSLLRNFLFGLFPTVLILYLIYYNILAFTFGLLGRRKWKKAWETLLVVLPTACLCTALFTALDNVITPLFFRFNETAWKGYAVSSVAVMIPQIICVLITVGVLFLPLVKVFSLAKRTLGNNF